MTTFVDGSTVIYASWLNAIDAFYNTLFAGATTAAAARTAISVLSSSEVATTYAPLASPTFTGTPSLPTGTTGVTQTNTDNTTKIATTAFVQSVALGSGGLPLTQASYVYERISSTPITLSLDATYYDITFDTEVQDDLSENTPGTGTFTATYTGIYTFSGSILFGCAGTINSVYVRINNTTTTDTYAVVLDYDLPTFITRPTIVRNFSLAIPLTAGDAVIVQAMQNGNEGGNAVTVATGTRLTIVRNK